MNKSHTAESSSVAKNTKNIETVILLLCQQIKHGHSYSYSVFYLI